VSVTSGSTYQIEFTLAGVSAGSVGISLGAVAVVNTGADTAFASSATFKRTVVAGATGTVALTITPTTTYNGSIDAVTLKLVTLGSVTVAGALLNSDSSVGVEMRSGGIGLNNTFIGTGVGRSNTTGTYNTANGYRALYSNTTGAENTASGLSALNSNTTGSYNTANGLYALYSNTTGSYNTANGRYALNANTTGSSNTANGVSALYSNTTGINNTANGMSALYSNTTGSYNTASGLYAGRYIADGTTANAITDNSIYIGYDSRALANNQTNQIVIGYQAIGNGSNTTTIGNTSTTDTYLLGKLNLTKNINTTFATGVTAEIGRGTTDTDITYLSLRSANGTLYYLYPDDSGALILSTTKP
jgi:hypothetical protein